MKTNELKRKKKIKCRLLTEPTVEEERLAGQLAGKSGKIQSDTHLSSGSSSNPTFNGANQRDQDASALKNNVIFNTNHDATNSKRTRNKSQLTSLLTVLFGLVLFFGCLAILARSTSAQSLSKFANGSTTMIMMDRKQSTLQNGTITNDSAAAKGNETQSAAAATTTSEPTSESETESLSATTMAGPANESSSRAEGDNSNDGEHDESSTPEEATDEASSNENNSSHKSKLGDLIVSGVNDVADLLLIKKQASGSENEADDSETTEEAGINATTSGDSNNKLDENLKKRQTSVSEEGAAKPQESTFDAPSDELKSAIDTWMKWRATGDDIVELFSKKLMPIIVEHGYDIDTSTVTGVLQVFNAIRQLKPWALKLIDAWTKLSPGILVGTQSDFGDYDECLSVYSEDPNNLVSADLPVEYDEATGLPTTTVVGRYCLADIEFPKPPRHRLAQRDEELHTDFKPIELRRPLLDFNQSALFKDTIFVETGNFLHMLYVDPMRVGFCLTNKIDPDSFAKVFNILVEDFKVSIHFRGRCVTKYDKVQWTIQQRVSAYVLVVACSLVLLSTLLDLLHLKLNKLPVPSRLLNDLQLLKLQEHLRRHRPIFTAFSIIRNTKRLFKPQASKHIQWQQQQRRRSHHQLHHQEQSASSIESTPSIERRFSMAGSASNLISEPSTISSGSGSLANGLKTSNLLRARNLESNLDCKQLTLLNQFSDCIVAPNGKIEQQVQLPNLQCLHGIRVITMIWMIVNHTYLFGGFFVLWAHRRLIDIAEWPKSMSFQLVLNGWLTVETYFFLSALIIVLNVMPLLKLRKFNYFSYIFHRLLRLLPAYTGLICLNFLWPLISAGPVWLVKGKSFIQTPCENYLWTNYLFINNWIWPEKQCMVHTWFLSADLQLYLLAPLIVYVLFKRPVFGHSVNLLVAVIASIISGLVIYANKLLPSTLINKLEFDSIKQQLSYSYFATYQHMGPYCLGIFVGYLLYKRPHMQLPKHLTWTLWLLLPPLSFTTLFLTYLWNGAYNEPELINPSPLVSAFYVAIHRTIWTSLVAWIVFACATGRAKLLTQFLSHAIFIPLSRLSFSIYLVHLPIIMFRALNLRHTIEWTDSNILWEACGNFIVSLIFGYFLNVAFESPFINLESAISHKRNNSHSSSTNGQSSASCQKDVLHHQNSVSSSIENDSDSDEKLSQKSKTSESDQTQSSPEENRKLVKPAPSTTTTETTTSDENNLLVKRKLLRPKQTSVERIFGHQMEQASSAPFYSTSQKQESQLSSLSTTNNDELDIIYPMTSEYYPASQVAYGNLRGNYQPTGANYLRNSQRSMQYATLARTSRFNHPIDSYSLRDRFDYQRSSLNMMTPINQRKPRSLLDDHHGGSFEAEHLEEYGLPAQRSRTRHGQLNQRRLGRYNTLTGGASSLVEWRQQHQYDLPSTAWKPRVVDQSMITTSNWLQQSGALMIPRVDSSTLRRQQHQVKQRNEQQRIVEEEAATTPTENLQESIDM